MDHIFSPSLTLSDALHEIASESFFWVSNPEGHFKLYHSKCRFIETENRHLIFHCEQEIIRETGKISDIMEKLPDSQFFRCSNSYIVNLHYISHILPEGNRYNIHLLTGEIIPLSRSRYRDCLVRLNIT